MKRSKTLLLILGVIIAITLTITQSLHASDAKQFIQSKSIPSDQSKKVSHLTIAAFSFELFTKNLPYLNSK